MAEEGNLPGKKFLPRQPDLVRAGQPSRARLSAPSNLENPIHNPNDDSGTLPAGTSASTYGQVSPSVMNAEPRRGAEQGARRVTESYARPTQASDQRSVQEASSTRFKNASATDMALSAGKLAFSQPRKPVPRSVTTSNLPVPTTSNFSRPTTSNLPRAAGESKRNIVPARSAVQETTSSSSLLATRKPTPGPNESKPVTAPTERDLQQLSSSISPIETRKTPGPSDRKRNTVPIKPELQQSSLSISPLASGKPTPGPHESKRNTAPIEPDLLQVSSSISPPATRKSAPGPAENKRKTAPIKPDLQPSSASVSPLATRKPTPGPSARRETIRPSDNRQEELGQTADTPWSPRSTTSFEMDLSPLKRTLPPSLPVDMYVKSSIAGPVSAPPSNFSMPVVEAGSQSIPGSNAYKTTQIAPAQPARKSGAVTASISASKGYDTKSASLPQDDQSPATSPVKKQSAHEVKEFHLLKPIISHETLKSTRTSLDTSGRVSPVDPVTNNAEIENARTGRKRFPLNLFVKTSTDQTEDAETSIKPDDSVTVDTSLPIQGLPGVPIELQDYVIPGAYASAMPTSRWSGAFMGLTDNIATDVMNAPQASEEMKKLFDEDERAKVAFIILAVRCGNAAALDSLKQFRAEYVKQFLDKKTKLSPMAFLLDVDLDAMNSYLNEEVLSPTNATSTGSGGFQAWVSARTQPVSTPKKKKGIKKQGSLGLMNSLYNLKSPTSAVSSTAGGNLHESASGTSLFDRFMKKGKN